MSNSRSAPKFDGKPDSLEMCQQLLFFKKAISDELCRAKGGLIFMGTGVSIRTAAVDKECINAAGEVLELAHHCVSLANKP